MNFCHAPLDVAQFVRKASDVPVSLGRAYVVVPVRMVASDSLREAIVSIPVPCTIVVSLAHHTQCGSLDAILYALR